MQQRALKHYNKIRTLKYQYLSVVLGDIGQGVISWFIQMTCG
jgi:hypothetical protein